MNHPFVKAQAGIREARQDVKGDGQRIDHAYRLLYSRPPTADEKIGREFLARRGGEA